MKRIKPIIWQKGKPLDIEPLCMVKGCQGQATLHVQLDGLSNWILCEHCAKLSARLLKEVLNVNF